MRFAVNIMADYHALMSYYSNTNCFQNSTFNVLKKSFLESFFTIFIGLRMDFFIAQVLGESFYVENVPVASCCFSE